MKVVALNGSPRKNGNTAILIDTVLTELQKEGIETERIQLGGKKIHGCTACMKCFANQDKHCSIDNDILNEVVDKMIEADGIIIGSPTINQNTLLPVYKLFSVINPIRDKGKPAAAFGSFGWSGESVKLIEDHLRNLKLKIVGEGQTARFFPNSKETESLIRFGEEFVKAFQEEK